jgi:hypothetical protein
MFVPHRKHTPPQSVTRIALHFALQLYVHVFWSLCLQWAAEKAKNSKLNYNKFSTNVLFSLWTKFYLKVWFPKIIISQHSLKTHAYIIFLTLTCILVTRKKHYRFFVFFLERRIQSRLIARLCSSWYFSFISLYNKYNEQRADANGMRSI